MYDAETNGYDGGKKKRKGRDEKVEKRFAVFGLACRKELSSFCIIEDFAVGSFRGIMKQVTSRSL